MWINVILGVICVDALLVAMFVGLSRFDRDTYDRWEAEMRRKGIQWPIQDLQDVPYRETANRLRDRL